MRFNSGSFIRIILIGDLIAIPLLVAGFALVPSGSNWNLQKHWAVILLRAGGIMSGLLAAGGSIVAVRQKELTKHRMFLVVWWLSLLGFLAWLLFGSVA